jgi:hypothetical protein
MLEHTRQLLGAQYEAALCMMDDCIQLCPQEHWDGLVGKYPFWMVAYHTLCFVDLYLAPSQDAFELRKEFHPKGWDEYEGEYPSRRFAKDEISRYLQICLEKARATFAAETEQSLAAPNGHGRKNYSRHELHLYNLRHIQHHTGQLSVFVRKVGADPKWIGSGWKDFPR